MDVFRALRARTADSLRRWRWLVRSLACSGLFMDLAEEFQRDWAEFFRMFSNVSEKVMLFPFAPFAVVAAVGSFGKDTDRTSTHAVVDGTPGLLDSGE